MYQIHFPHTKSTLPLLLKCYGFSLRNGSRSQSPADNLRVQCLAQRHLEPLDRPPCPAMLPCAGAVAPSGAGSPPGAPMLLFLLPIRLAASAMEAMRLPCRTGEHSHALQVPSRRPRGTQRAHRHTHKYTTAPAGCLEEEEEKNRQQLRTENNPLNKDKHVYSYIMYSMLCVCSAASGLKLNIIAEQAAQAHCC